MPFKEGQSGNENGRPKGSANKETKQLREFLANVLDNNRDKFEDELNKLEGKDYINAVSNLMEYCTPKLQRSEIEIKESINWSEIPLEDRKVLNTLNDKYQLN